MVMRMIDIFLGIAAGVPNEKIGGWMDRPREKYVLKSNNWKKSSEIIRENVQPHEFLK